MTTRTGLASAGAGGGAAGGAAASCSGRRSEPAMVRAQDRQPRRPPAAQATGLPDDLVDEPGTAGRGSAAGWQRGVVEDLVDAGSREHYVDAALYDYEYRRRRA